jgi:predicted RNase H-like HicB family nuclease
MRSSGIEMTTVTAYIEKDLETGLYVAIVPGIPGAHTQAETLDELQENLIEVLELCLEEMEPENKQHLPQFVGIQQVVVSS